MTTSLAELFDAVKAKKRPAARPDWKSKILTAQVKTDDWDFTGSNDLSKRAQFHAEWEEVELCYIIQPVHCETCGWQHDEHWGIFLHEQHRRSATTTKFSRLTKNLSALSHLPRRVVTHEPVKAQTCDRCFLLGEAPQLELPLEDLPASTVEHIATALVAVNVMHEEHMKWKAKKSPEVYGFDMTDEEAEVDVKPKRPGKPERTKPVDEAFNW